MAEPQKVSDLALVKRVWPYVGRYRNWLLVTALAIPTGVAGVLVQPMLLKQGIDVHIANGDFVGLTIGG